MKETTFTKEEKCQAIFLSEAGVYARSTVGMKGESRAKMVDVTCIWPFSVMNQLVEAYNRLSKQLCTIFVGAIAEVAKFFNKLSKTSTLDWYISPRLRSYCIGFPITLIEIVVYHKASMQTCRKDLPVGGKLIAAGSPYIHFCNDSKHKF